MGSEELEQICFNFNHFFPDKNEITEHGICLDDEEFSPSIILPGSGLQRC